jgi:predicted GIY-YIG superfamily endonuclease
MEAKSFVGRIYKLTSPDIDKVYVGSTTQTLKGRLWDHKSAYEAFTQRGKGSRVTAFEILKYSNVDVELLVEETFTSNSITIIDG